MAPFLLNPIESVMEKTNSVSLDGLVSVCHSFRKHDDGGVEADFTLSTAIANPEATAAMPIKDRIKEFMHHRIKVVAAAGVEAEALTDLAESCRRGDSEVRIYKAKGTLIDLGDESLVLCSWKDFQKSKVMTLSNNNDAVIAGTIVSISHSDAFATVKLDTGVSTVMTHFSKATFGVAWDSIDSGKLRKGDMLWMKGPLLSQNYTDGVRTVRRAVLTPHQMKQIKLKQDVTTKKKKSRGVD